MKPRKFEVSGSSRSYTVVDDDSSGVSNLVSIFIKNNIILPYFSSKTPSAWTNQVQKIPRFLSCHIAVCFFYHHDIPQWSEQQVPPTCVLKKNLMCRCGRLITVSLVLCEASDKISTNPKSLTSQPTWSSGVVDRDSTMDRNPIRVDYTKSKRLCESLRSSSMTQAGVTTRQKFIGMDPLQLVYERRED